MKLKIQITKVLLEHTHLSQAECARRSGVSEQTIGQWLKGKRNPSGPLIQKFAAFLHVSVDDLVDYESDLERAAVHGDKFASAITASSEAELVTEAIGTYPVISEAAAVEASGSCYYPISDWAEQYAEESVGFSDGKPGDFVIRVTGNSMMSWYSAGTLVLVRPNALIRNGNRVVAILEDGSMVFKTFAEKGENIHLFSINDEEGKDFHFSKSRVRGLRLYLVIQSMRNENAIDSAMDAKGLRHSWQDKLANL